MSGGYKDIIQFIRTGETVSPGTPNRVTRDLDGNIRFLKNLLEAAEIGEAVFARDQTIEAEASVGMPVYWDGTMFRRGLAQVTTDVTTGAVTTADSAQIWGVVYEKESSTLGCIMLSGFAALDIALAVDGAVESGVYYLSGSSLGGLVQQRPPVTVPVLIADGGGNVYVNTQITDFLHDHVHYKYDLVAAPAGEHSPPAEGDPHVITAADDTLEGWLPADDPIFEGNAPLGAAFGYNIGANISLNSSWPPIPVEAATMEMLNKNIFENVKGLHVDAVLDFGSIAVNDFEDLTVSVPGAQLIDIALVSLQGGPTSDGVIQAWVSAVDVVTVRYTNTGGGGPIDPASATYHVQVLKDESDGVSTSFQGFEGVPDDFVVMDANGIWWMTDCYNQVPWPTDLDTDSSESISEEDCPVNSDFKIRIFFNKLSFLTDQSVVTSLVTDDDRIEIVCENDPATTARTGPLLIRLALQFLIDETDVRGYNVFKTFDPATNTFDKGDIVEGLYALGSNVDLTGEASQVINVGGTDRTVHQGIVGISVEEQGTQELNVQLIRLDGATEEFFEEVPYVAFPDDELTRIRCQINVPSTVTLATPKLRIRLRMLGRAAGTLPTLTLTGRRIPEDSGTALPLPTVDSPITITTAVAVGANEYIEAESDPIDVVAGDIFLFTVERAEVDGYTGEMGILQQVGTVSGS